MDIRRLVAVLAAPLLLASCLLTPGKFVSTLDVRADRSFTFTYVGEAILLDPAESAAVSSSGEDDSQPKPPAEPAVESQEQLAKRRAIAEALSKEAGYRSATYLGEGKYRVDYVMKGTLDRGFVYPYNPDAMAIIPWASIEVRQDKTVRFKAPAFGAETKPGGAMGMPGDSKEMAGREGSFTLTTDAELVMHNNEEGAAPGPGTRVVWNITPATQTVPTAVLRFAR